MFENQYETMRASQVAIEVKSPLANAELRDTGWILGLDPWVGGAGVGVGEPGVGNGNPLQYSCLENPMDRGFHGGLQPMGVQVEYS